MSRSPHPAPDWREIDTVLLDLDGTLLDQAYDNHIWRDLVPQRFAVANSLDLHVAWLPGAREFLARLRAAGKRTVLLTNSHPIALAVKHEESGVLDHLDAAATSHEFGAPKEHPQFWHAARARFGFDPARSLFADDNSKMLDAAKSAGVRWVYGVRHWDTKGSRREHTDHDAVDAVLDLMGTFTVS
jgi:putative hydrolase of the HAD superfamily